MDRNQNGSGPGRDILDRHEGAHQQQQHPRGDDDDNDGVDGDDHMPHQQQHRPQHHLGVPRYRGVSYEKRKNLWRARLYCRGQHTTLGRYSNARLAAAEHDRAASFVFGERAVTNFGPQTVDLTAPLPFGRTISFKLAGLRDMMRRNHEGAPGLPNEQQARAMRMAAAAAAFYPNSLAPPPPSTATATRPHASPAPPSQSPRLQPPPPPRDWATEHQLSGQVLAAITLAGGGMFARPAASFRGGGGGGDFDERYEDAGRAEQGHWGAERGAAAAGAAGRFQVTVGGSLSTSGQLHDAPLARSAWQALILAAATCSPHSPAERRTRRLV